MQRAADAAFAMHQKLSCIISSTISQHLLAECFWKEHMHLHVQLFMGGKHRTSSKTFFDSLPLFTGKSHHQLSGAGKD